MRTLLALCLVTLAACQSCASTGTGTSPPVVPAVVAETAADCSKEVVKRVALEHLTEVEQALVGDWKVAAIQLATEIGKEALACIIDHILNESRLDVHASADANARTKVSRGEEWLRDNKVTFTTKSP